MKKSEVIKKTETFVKSKMSADASGHDWWHIHRVVRNALHLAKKEKADLLVVEMAALLHDVDDWKLNKKGMSLAKTWLDGLNLEAKIYKHILEILKEISFKGAKVPSKLKTPEGKIVWDADKLDAIGAIGIARVFAYGGAYGYKIHDPSVRPTLHRTFKSYKNSHDKKINTAISHFYEKLLLLKDRMYTKTAKRLALQRHKFMEEFLEHFYSEWKSLS